MAGSPTRPPVSSSQVTSDSVSRSETCRSVLFEIEIPCILVFLNRNKNSQNSPKRMHLIFYDPLDCMRLHSIQITLFFFRVLGNDPESNSEDEEDPDVQEAVNELVPDLATEDDEAHLNLSLEEESSIIAEYRTMLLSAGYDSSSAAFKY